MTEKDLDEFEKEFGFKLLPTSFKKPLSEITKEEYRERIEYLYNAIINEIQIRRMIYNGSVCSNVTKSI